MPPFGPSRSRIAFTFALAIGLALAHLFAGRLGLDGRVPRSGWLSVAGGVSVAYVFVHLLPEINEAAATLAEHGPATAVDPRHGYQIALLGFVAFYGLERLARRPNTGPERNHRTGRNAGVLDPRDGQ